MTTVTDRAPLTRSDLREELNLFREEIRTHYATKADLERLRGDIRGDILRLTIGLAGLQLIGLGAVAAIMRLLGS